MRILMLLLLLLNILLVGCETIHEGAQEVGKPIGAAAKTVGGVTEGAAEAYGDKETDNPYNR